MPSNKIHPSMEHLSWEQARWVMVVGGVLLALVLLGTQVTSWPFVSAVPLPGRVSDRGSFSSHQVQRLLGHRADRLVSDYLEGRGLQGNNDVTKVVLGYSILPGCSIALNRVMVQSESDQLATAVEEVLRQGLERRVDAPGCTRMQGKVAGEVTLIHVLPGVP